MVKTIESWDGCDKVSAALCYLRYNTLEKYIEALDYSNDLEAGKASFLKSKKLYKQLHQIFTDKEINDLWYGLNENT
jgi:hypothetical protein